MLRLAMCAALAAATFSVTDTHAQSTAKVVPEIEIGSANWSKMPVLQTADRLDYSRISAAISDMFKSGECKMPGQSARRFDISVPYAVLLSPSGKVQRVLVSQTGCAALEDLVGESAIALSEAGLIPPTGASEPRWYADEFGVALR